MGRAAADLHRRQRAAVAVEGIGLDLRVRGEECLFLGLGHVVATGFRREIEVHDELALLRQIAQLFVGGDVPQIVGEEDGGIYARPAVQARLPRVCIMR